MFMTADVGIGVEVSATLVTAAEFPILVVTGTNSGVVLVIGTAGGTR